MKLTDTWMIRSKRFRTYYACEVYFAGFAAGEAPPPIMRWHWFDRDYAKSYRWMRHQMELCLAELPIDPDELELVRGPMCCCCGVESGIQLVGRTYDHQLIWRCEKHVRRNPCLVDGCGKTFAHTDDETYQCTVICGRHWRLGPKRMRDAVARVRRQAKRTGWTDELITRNNRLWHRTVREIVNGTKLDEAEINRVMGWE